MCVYDQKRERADKIRHHTLPRSLVLLVCKIDASNNTNKLLFSTQRGFALPRMRAVARQLQDIPGSYEAKTLAQNAILLLHSTVECLFFTLHIFVR